MENSASMFCNKIQCVLEKHNIKQSDLAQKINVPISTFNKFIHGTTEADLWQVVDLVREVTIYERDLQEHELMIHYMQGIQNSSNLKSGMEYSDMHNLTDSLHMLFDRALSKADHKNNLREYVNTYKLNLERKKQRAETTISNDLFKDIMSLDNKSADMRVFRGIIEVELYHQQKEFYRITELVPELQRQLELITNSGIRLSFNVRINRLLQNLHLRYLGDVEKACELANELLALGSKIGRQHEAASLITLADSRAHEEDPTQAIQHLKVVIAIYKEIGLHYAADWMMEKLQFLGILRGVDFDQVYHINNKALHHIIKGDNAAGLAILDKLDESPMRWYIRGLATRDPIFFWKSLESYIQRGDRLYGRFSVLELQRLGERKEAIDSLYDFSSGGVIN